MRSKEKAKNYEFQSLRVSHFFVRHRKTYVLNNFLLTVKKLCMMKDLNNSKGTFISIQR